MASSNKPKIKPIKTPENFDHINIGFEIDGELKGFGYIGKADHEIGLTKCPICNKNNYSLCASSGICAWCGFNANECQRDDMP